MLQRYLILDFISSNVGSLTLFLLLFLTQLKNLQDQVATLKTSNEHHQKQNEDMISKLKEVCIDNFEVLGCFSYRYYFCLKGMQLNLQFSKWKSTWSKLLIIVWITMLCSPPPFYFQAKEQQTTIEDKFRNELNANIKLSNLYKVGTNV